MNKTTSRLGRGLGSLIAGGTSTNPESKEAIQLEATTPLSSSASPIAKNPPSSVPVQAELNGKELLEIPTDTVVPNPYQPRKVIDPEAIRELAESINAEGLLQPIVVRKVDDGFQLIAGERRLRAHQHLQRQTVLARVLQVNELSSASLSLIENLQREGLNPMEEAMGYDSLVKEFGLTQAKVAERVGKSRSYVTNSLRFLQLEGELQEFLASGSLSTGHAKILLGVEDSKLRIKLAHLTISEGWSVRQCQQAVDDHRAGQSNPSLIRKAVRGHGAFSDLARALEAKLGRAVRIQAGSKGQGKLTLGFSDQNDLESILSSLDS